MRLSAAIPAMPVRSVDDAVRFYIDRLGFAAVHADTGLAVVVRDDVEIHLWSADDTRWRFRSVVPDDSPVVSGAESFIAGTASCRVHVDDVDDLYEELQAARVLHPTEAGTGPTSTDFGTREFATLDLDGNLLTFFDRPR